MSDMPFLTVIVPIYNCGPYLERCVDSLLSSSLRDTEIVLVDDASSDGSLAIAEGYARKNDRVFMLHHAVNRGLGASRNTGLRLARGTYVAFIDADDWVEPDHFERLARVAMEERCDVVAGGHRDFRDDKPVAITVHPLAGVVLRDPVDIEAVRRKLYGPIVSDGTKQPLLVSACTALYRLEMLRENKVEFCDCISEDVLFNLDAYAVARTIAFTSEVGYCYRKDGQPSITGSFDSAKVEKYDLFVQGLLARAQLDSHACECIRRCLKTAVDCSRMYAEGVVMAVPSLRSSIEPLEALIRSPLFAKASRSVRSDQPFLQRVLQAALDHHWIALAAFGIRLKRGVSQMRCGR